MMLQKRSRRKKSNFELFRRSRKRSGLGRLGNRDLVLKVIEGNFFERE